MAKTYPKYPANVGSPSDSYLGYVTRHPLEGASQTWPVGSPIVWASGYVAVFVAPATEKLYGFAKKAGQNGTAGQYTTEVILAVPGLVWYLNFLGAAAADNVLAQTDFGVAYDLAKGTAAGADGSDIWYLKDATADPVFFLIGKQADYVFPALNDSDAASGDTNARVACFQKAGTGAFV